MTDIFTDPKMDKPLVRKQNITTDGKQNDYVVKPRGDEYGFWVIAREHGQVPKELADQCFTTATIAEQYLKEYLAR